MKELQERVKAWMAELFPQADCENRRDRALRVLEEATELAQAEGVPLAKVDRVVARAYTRPVGDPNQEAAGIGLALLAWAAHSAKADLSDMIEGELALASTPERMAAIREKQAAKVADGVSMLTPEPLPFPGEVSEAHARVTRAEAGLRAVYAAAAEDPEKTKALGLEPWLIKVLSLPVVSNPIEFPVKVSGIIKDSIPTVKQKDAGRPVSVQLSRMEDPVTGVYLGDLGISSMMTYNRATEVLEVGQMKNPAFWVPSMGRVVWGAESGWEFCDEAGLAEKAALAAET